MPDTIIIGVFPWSAGWLDLYLNGSITHKVIIDPAQINGFLLFKSQYSGVEVESLFNIRHTNSHMMNTHNLASYLLNSYG
jgi:hypothetical protein